MASLALAPLLQNAALLLAMAVVYDLATSRRPLDGAPWRQALAGSILGAIGVAIMLAPLTLEPGIVFDTRSVLLAVSGLFLGAVPTAVAAAITAAFRLAQGGAAAGVGVAVILASSAIGVAWRGWRLARLADLSWRELYGFGIVVHLVMLGLMLGLPWDSARRVLASIGLPVLLVHPLATAALGALLVNRLRRERSTRLLEDSESRYREREQETRRLLDEVEASRRVLLSVVEDQKRTAAALRLQTTALEAAANAIVITDREGRVEWVNRAFTTLTGYTAAESLGRNPRELVRSGEQADAFYRDLWDTILSGRVWRGELVNRRKDGSTYAEEQTITPVRNAAGEIAHFIGVKQDVSARRRAERERKALDAQLRQAQKMESVGRLAGGIAHDFNNALGVILGRSELALGAAEAGTHLARHLEAIREAGLRSASLTRQLLAFARMQTIEPRVLDLNASIGALLAMLKQLIGEDVHLAWRPGPSPMSVKTDPAQIGQVLTNLVVNARDALGGVGEIVVSTDDATFDEAARSSRAVPPPGRYVMLCVRDDGPGMPPEVLDHLFEPFFTTKPVGHGTGLGLATVYGIVKQNEGYVDVDSSPGRGTTFRIYLPRAAERAAEAPAARARAEQRPRSETVLLVEDEPGMLEVTAETLTELGFQVLAAGRPAAAIELARTHAGPIDLLLTDVVMPEMNGRELAERVVALRPGIRRLFVSGYTADVIARRGVLEEGTRLLQKPFTRDDLASKVRQALDD
ncbi:MAG: LytS/YhcK type 5TM receptor domain-containing protein [Vicinamibacteria bacterium]